MTTTTDQVERLIQWFGDLNQLPDARMRFGEPILDMDFTSLHERNPWRGPFAAAIFLEFSADNPSEVSYSVTMRKVDDNESLGTCNTHMHFDPARVGQQCLDWFRSLTTDQIGKEPDNGQIWSNRDRCFIWKCSNCGLMNLEGHIGCAAFCKSKLISY